MEINKPDPVENRSGKDRRLTFLNGLDRRHPLNQGDERSQADSGVLIEPAESILSQSETGFESG